MAPKRVLLIAGNFVEDYEAMVPFQALQGYGVAVDAVCPGRKAGDFCVTATQQMAGHQTYSETRGHNFTLNATFDEVEGSNYDALVLPGGRAPEYLTQNVRVVELVREFSTSGKPIATYCHSQVLLAAADALKNRKITAYAPVGPTLIAAGANWVEPQSLESFVVDANIISSVCYLAHAQSIHHLVKAMGGTITATSKRILLLCGDYMEDYEVMVPFEALRALGCHVDAVCPKKKSGDTCPTAIHDFEGYQHFTEKPGHDFVLNATFGDVDASGYDALVIPGGRAAEYLALNETIISWVKHFVESNKPIAAISYGQQILVAADVLKGRKVTAYPAMKLNMVLAGATWIEPNPITLCITDGNLITGASWLSHPHFISHLMALLGISVSF
ncbi:hypothetical protein HN51_050248 [Arachis hypogaea]|uniref:DJ-1/PfpI domain-containing protein n=1 Tax=Arachis hypogaea TaxID=3818 RepID=A0A444YC59_ARAHY|nr:protein DJ-1 homolog D [Arachis ipaensis]XP_025668694.1 protein DJ-1 homolog D [Arachis hypogaea]QHN91963.1 uncharacterized protein DS421_17g579550 [Arachis hypogaea]RYQ99503.1 hypothetical protein Ahy_B07g087437 [Arachis hypogaea]